MNRLLTIALLSGAALAGSAQQATAGGGTAFTAPVGSDTGSLTAPLGPTKGSVVAAIVYNGHAGLGAN